MSGGSAQSPSPRQLALKLAHEESLSREDFLLGPSNESGFGLIDRWPDWPAQTVALVGPQGAGKSHLAAIWATASGARSVSARMLATTPIPGTLATGALVLEDVSPDTDERALFHLINLSREEGAFLLLTARDAPAAWGTSLADLASRLRALPVVTLASPDDVLLRSLLVKLFADRQLAVDESLVGYLASRIERSFAAAHRIVERLDQEALRLQRPVNRALASELFRKTPP